jgi:hypothetical protein
MNDNDKEGRFATYYETVAALRREEFATEAEWLLAFPPRRPKPEELQRRLFPHIVDPSLEYDD